MQIAPCYTQSVRFPDESKEAFRARAEKAGHHARILVMACLQNLKVQEFLEQGLLKENGLRSCPIVRVEYEQAIAFGRIGETLHATKNKHWGNGPSIMPLEPDDEFFVDRITYLYRENSLYNRRFEQRVRLKELLGKDRKLVGEAKYFGKAIFLRRLTTRQSAAIRRILKIEPGEFWRAVNGKILNLPQRDVQQEFDFEAE